MVFSSSKVRICKEHLILFCAFPQVPSSTKSISLKQNMTEGFYTEKNIQCIAGLRTQLLHKTPICVYAFLGVFVFIF